jgi:serine/threonine-protein kinase HipA
MARAAGITMCDTRLIPDARGGLGFFATRRFDRTANVRHHVLTAAAILDADWVTPSIDYDQLLRLTRYATRNAADVAEMVRRMLFNVAAGNRDDHAKQHSFLMAPDGRWALSPAYDLSFSDGPGGEHYLAVGGVGRNVPTGVLLAMCAKHAVPEKRARAILDDVCAAIAQFRTIATPLGVTKSNLNAIGSALDASLRRYHHGD